METNSPKSENLAAGCEARALAVAPGSAFTVRAYNGAPDIKVTHVRGNRYRVDNDKDGMAVTIKGPIYKREPTSFELRFRFDVLLHNG